MADLARGLARYRVRIGFVSALAALWLAQPTLRSLTLGAVIAAAGELLRIWAAGHLEKGREVTASGPYRWTRHPLYLGSTIIAIGFAVAAANVTTAILVAVYLVLTYGAAITSEEKHLTEKFGAAYPENKEGRVIAVDRRFSVERALRNREYRAVAGLLLALALLTWKVL
jgi:protein-S-isoprenylcysteine O-methyltransferase Ste14